LNLIKNAEDILIENKISKPIIGIKIINTKDFKYNKLIITDNAGGIPENIISNIFDPYFSTKKEKDGTGLGLYMSKIIIEEHCRGKISVINDQQGAVFIVALPKISKNDTDMEEELKS
jgi:signal transduction histidine kinase